MSSANPGNSVHCPDCGSANLAESTKCFICGQSLISDEPRAAPQAPLAASRSPKNLSTPKTMPQAVGSLLVITLIILCIGIGFESPGLGIGLAVVLMPALIRTLLISSEKRERGTPPTALELGAAGCGSVLVVITVGVAAAATFCGVCFAGFFGVQLAGSSFFKNDNPIQDGFVVGGFVGVVAGIFVAVILIRRLWPRKKK